MSITLYTLTMTLLTSPISSGKFDIVTTTVPGFQTEIACRYHAGQLEVLYRNDFKIDTGKRFVYVCTPTSK